MTGSYCHELLSRWVLAAVQIVHCCCITACRAGSRMVLHTLRIAIQALQISLFLGKLQGLHDARPCKMAITVALPTFMPKAGMVKLAIERKRMSLPGRCKSGHAAQHR